MIMKKVEVKELSENFFEAIGKEWMLVTAGNKEAFNTMTASWGGIGWLWNKPVAFVFVRPERYTYEFIEKGDFLTLSFLGEENKKIHAVCGSKSGREVDKVKETGLKPLFTAQGNVPSTVPTAPKLPNGKSPFSSIGWKFWNNLRRLLMRRLFLPVLLFVLFTVFSARAGQPSYSADVTVDVTADNASAARELAMRRANRQAVSAIAANFTTREGVTVLNKLKLLMRLLIFR